jgi:YidC/Oxa1 family membrane protein insertase
MDRNTLTGLVLIGLILTVFSIFNQPSDEDIKKKAKTEQVNAKEKAAAKKESAKARKWFKRCKTSKLTSI